jgi:hypothetical protein
MERDSTSKGAGKGGKGKGGDSDAVKCATGCGKPGTKRCNGCKAVFYCSVECQRIHWKKNGHKVACKKTQARVAAAMASPAGGARAQGGGGTATGASVCTICLDAGDPLPIQSGCGCRGDAGLAHVGCRAEAAEHRSRSRDTSGWHECMTCGQHFTGQMLLGLTELWWSAVQGFDEENEERQDAGCVRASALGGLGRWAESEAMLRELRAVQRRMPGPDSGIAMNTAEMLGAVLFSQDKYGDAEVVISELLPKQREQLGDEDPGTLMTLLALGNVLLVQGKFDDALATFQYVRSTQERVLGAEHANTLGTTMNIGNILLNQSKYQESEVLYIEVIGVQQRVLGAEHPLTLNARFGLCTALFHQKEHGEAEAKLREVLAASRRVLGADHPTTVGASQLLARIS